MYPVWVKSKKCCGDPRNVGGKERKALLDTPTLRGTKRTTPTVNRYMASLSSLLSLTTGARQGEILNLEWRHIDLTSKNKCIYFENHFSRYFKTRYTVTPYLLDI